MRANKLLSTDSSLQLLMGFANVVLPIVGLQGCRGNGEVMRGLKYDVRLPGSVNLKVKKGKRARRM